MSLKEKRKKLKGIIWSFLIKIINLIIPQDEKVILIGGWFGKRFADNSRYLYLYLNEHKEKLGLKKIVFITNKEEILKEIKTNFGYEVYLRNSLKSIYYHLKAKFHIVDQSGKSDLIAKLGINAIKVNLWHGIPLKKVGYINNEPKKAVAGNWQNNFLLTCSNFGKNILGKAFKCSADRCINGMYPRNYFLITDKENWLLPQEKIILKKIENIRKEGKRIIIYLPTFRDKQRLLFLGEKSQEKLKNFFEFLEENKYFLITKIHFAGTEIIEKGRDNISFFYKSFLNLESDMDVYPFLKISDMLITDYSSVYFDYLYLNKEVIFYPYDLEYYQKDDRGLFFIYDEITPGNKVYNLEELKIILKDLKNKRDNFSEERKTLLEKCFEKWTLEDTVQNILNLKE